jgi:hypothetical protein
MTMRRRNGHPRRTVTRVAGVVWLLWLSATTASAQTMLSGIVYDPSDFAVIGVPVVVQNEATGRTWSTVSSAIGQYRFEMLPPGRYRVNVDVALSPTAEDCDSPTGDTDVSSGDDSLPTPLKFQLTGFEVRRGIKTALDIRLQLAVAERVDVESPAPPPVLEAPPLGTDTIGMTFSGDFFEQPLTNGRTIQSALALVPNAVVTESVGTLAQFTAAGQRRFSNRLTIDGVSADLAVDVLGPGIGQAGSGTLPAFATSGGTQTLVPTAAIEEIQIVTTNATSENARSPGAQTSIVTRAGGDRFSAKGFADVRPDRLAARDWFSNSGETPRRETTFWNVGTSMGGPALPGRIFYFGSWESQRVDRPVTATTQVPSMAARGNASTDLRRLLDSFPQPNGADLGEGLAEFTGKFPATSKFSVFSVRADASLSTRHRFFVRTNIGKSSGDLIDPILLAPRYTFTQVESAETRTATAGWTSLWSATAHDLRINRTEHQGSMEAREADYGGANPLPFDLLLPEGIAQSDTWLSVSIFPGPGGILSSGRSAALKQLQTEISDTWSFLRGRHDWRVGFTYRHLTGSTNPALNQYSYTFRGFDVVPSDSVAVAMSRVGSASSSRDSWSLFLQDAFRISPRLSLNYGLRYNIRPAPRSNDETQPLLISYSTLPEIEFLPRGTSLWDAERTGIAPRISIVYQAGTTSGYETTLNMASSVIFDDVTSPGMRAFGATFPYLLKDSSGVTPFPVSAAALTVSAPTPFGADDSNTDYYAFRQDLRLPRTYEWQAGLDQALGANQRLGVAYVGTAGRDLIYWYRYDAGQNVRVNAFSNSATSDYHALVVEFVRRLSQRWQGRLAYTWSHAIDTDSGETLFAHLPPETSSTLSERGSADFDRRHVLHTSWSYRLPTPTAPRFIQTLGADWQLDITGIVRSGTPFSVSASRTIGLGIFLVRPDLAPDQPLWLADPSSPTGRRLNREAFPTSVEPGQGTLGRNALRATPLRQVNLALSRSFQAKRCTVQIRLEAFNAFNIPSFGPPETSIALDQFGRPRQSYADALGSGTLTNGGLISVQQDGSPRSLQFGLRLSF